VGSTGPRYRQLGGHLCLDFVNTLDPRYGPVEERHDYLSSYDALVVWSEQVRVADRAEAAALRRRAGGHDELAASALDQALVFREHLDEVFTTFMQPGRGRRTAATDPALLNEWLAGAAPHRRLQLEPGGARWRWTRDPMPELTAPLLRVAVSAAEVLTTADPQRLRRCEGDSGHCGWLFYDSSRSGNRQWCSMSGCGNREKARRHRLARGAYAPSR
jgi:predicted RNA-binding Zn ribbon-like protein